MQIIAKKGVKIFRDFYIDMEIKPYTVPETVKIPIGVKNDGIVLKKVAGDKVEKCETVAYSKGDYPIYSPVNGIFMDVIQGPAVNGFMDMQYAVIKTDGTDLPVSPLWETKANYSKAELIDIIKKAGIFNEWAKGYFFDFINKKTNYKKLIIDCVDDQPYDLSRTAVLLNYQNEVIKGAEILCSAFGIPKTELLVMKNFCTESILKNGIDNIDIVKVGGKYPVSPEIVQYAHKNTALRVGVQCCRAVYRAAYFGEPQISSVVTVWGEGVQSPANLEVLNGTPIKYLLERCKAKGIIERVIGGGVMSGYVVSTEYPLMRGEDSLTAMPLKKHNQTLDCVNCGRCAEVCPMDLAPYFILRSSKKIGDKMVKQLCAGMCIFCGACSYICPSRQPLTQKIREYNDMVISGVIYDE